MKNSNSDPASLDKDDGWTNLSNQGKSTLPVAAQLQNVKKLNISRNSFKILELRALNRCIEVDASENEIQWLRFNGPHNSTCMSLEVLILCDNKLTAIDFLNRMHKLEKLDVSHNFIESFTSVDALQNITILNMGSNCLKTLPNLSKLVNLRVLNLAGNRIRNLTGISNLVLASKLRNFDIGNNLISDLCEFRNLQSFIYLELLFTFGNPCLSAVYANGGANLKIYRSYLISCIQPNQLKMLDSCVIAEDESLIGEQLHTDRTCRSFLYQKGKHGHLCRFLEGYAIDSSKNLSKVIKMRQNHNASFSSSNPTATNTDSEETVSRPTTAALQTIATSPTSSYSRSENQDKSYDAENIPFESPLNVSTNTIVLSSHEEPRPSEVVITSPKSKCLQVTDSMKKKRIFSFISSSKSKGKTNQKLISSKPIKAGLRHPKCRTPDAKVAVSQLKMQVESLNEFVEVQNAINETQSAALAEITQKFLKLESNYKMLESSLVPTPHSLVAELQPGSDEKNRKLILKWENTIPHCEINGFEISINDNLLGKIEGKERQATITDLTVGEDLKISIQTVSNSGIRSKTVDVYVHKESTGDGDGIENTTNSNGF